MALSYDLSAIKRIDSYKTLDVRLRTVILGASAVLHAWLNMDPTMVYWFIVHFAAFTIYAALVAKAPKRVASGQAALIMSMGIVALVTLVSASVYAFSYDGFENQFGGTVLFFAVAINILTIRVRTRTFFYLDISMVLLAGLGLIAVEFFRSGMAQSTLAVALGIGMFLVYFLILVFEMVGFRRKLDHARIGQLASEHQRTIGQISGGVAHDFNNLLTVVLGNLELSREIDDPAERNQLLAEAEAAARRGATLTGQLLAFSRKATLSPRVVFLDQIKPELEALAEGALGRAHRLQIGQVTDLPPLYIDVGTLTAVLLNLVLNSREAMPDGGTVWLDAEIGEYEGREMMCLRVNDTGTGIAPENIDKVFEPFFSTKPAGQGSGLGLPMAKGFAEQSGGGITLSSDLGDGTEVCLWLPMADASNLPENMLYAPASASMR